MTIDTVFTEASFWLLVAFSIVVPVGIYARLLQKRAISRVAMLAYGFILVFIAGIDIFLLGLMQTMAKVTPSLFDDAVFNSEISFALYLLPFMIGSIGVNIVSNVLLLHLVDAEASYDSANRSGASAGRIMANVGGRHEAVEAGNELRQPDWSANRLGAADDKDGFHWRRMR